MNFSSIGRLDQSLYGLFLSNISVHLFRLFEHIKYPESLLLIEITECSTQAYGFFHLKKKPFKLNCLKGFFLFFLVKTQAVMSV
ncbi:hypothetical protein DNU06_06025 [Putridiphycobacter roseus]|uniref:Uncharacterized protein n=1 Tax=Putridiphycobacter roseus TaxID=2219161 RepID=A0A2W1N3L8_9FLAO|nr:hypothetical protein DNU06_06025 [Putridiphycobacter roseus]